MGMKFHSLSGSACTRKGVRAAASRLPLWKHFNIYQLIESYPAYVVICGCGIYMRALGKLEKNAKQIKRKKVNIQPLTFKMAF